MAAETATIEEKRKQVPSLGDQDVHSKLLLEAQVPSLDLVSQNADKQSKEAAGEVLAKPAADGASKALPNLSLIEGQEQEAPAKKSADSLPAVTISSQDLLGKAVLPWEKNEDGVLRQHMSYRASKDAIVKLGEGPFHVAQRLLGPGAAEGDVKALTKALIDQYKSETKEDNLQHLRNGHRLLDENNISDVVSRIGDTAARERVIERLKEGWSEKEPPVAVPMEAHGRPGETHPSRIDDPAQFVKDITAAMVNVKADDYWRRGLCAAGFRLAINQLPLWRIDGGTVDRSINKDINGWRSGVQMALDLAQTGLFDVVPLKELGYKNLKQGYIVGRYHYPEYVKARPSWEGEDFGDIDVWTPRHKPANDDPSMYRDSFVLIPKGLKR